MEKIDILHIYPGTSGNIGLYMHSIYKSLENDFKQDVIVSYNYPFNYGRKVYYRYSDLANPNILHKLDKLRLIVRYLELLFALLYSVVIVLLEKPKVINYSLTSQLKLEYFFICIIKIFSNSQVWITAHDVVPFASSYSKKNKNTIAKRKSFFLKADRIIAHNNNSIIELVKYYSIKKSKILEYPFPILDLKDLRINNDISPEIEKYFINRKKSFLFIGHLRKEKGINILLNAWTRMGNIENTQLIIAGHIPTGAEYNFKNYSNIILINRFITDSEYQYLIKNAECVILPYTSGTNSGIPSNVVTLKTKLITSDIEMFRNNLLIDKTFLFKSENVNSLIEKIKMILEGSEYTFIQTESVRKMITKKTLEIYKNYINE